MASDYLYVRNFKLDRLFGLMTITGYLIILGLLCYWCMDRRMKKKESDDGTYKGGEV